MGRGDSRQSPKMRRRQQQRRLKVRIKRRRAEAAVKRAEGKAPVEKHTPAQTAGKPAKKTSASHA